MYDRNCKQTIRCKTATKQNTHKKERILHTMTITHKPEGISLEFIPSNLPHRSLFVYFFLSEIANCLFLFERPMMNHRPCTQGYNALSPVCRCCLFHLVCCVLFLSKSFRTCDWLKTTSYRSIYRSCFSSLADVSFCQNWQENGIGKIYRHQRCIFWIPTNWWSLPCNRL